MKKTLLASSVIALTLGAASTAFAVDVGSGTIEFNGTVNTGACSIAPSSINKEVQLGSIPAVSLKTAGAQGPNVDFTLELSNCVLDPSASGTDFSKVKVSFTGQMDPAGNLWANSGTAQNVGVLFQNDAGQSIKSGDTITQNMTAGANTINLSARMQALGQATSGSVKSTVAYVLDYQ
ncbi:fimbrial protein [Providencia sp. JUb39]|uniref:fimbrial protein n=1 Tax=Providencia sp. JUb39 TaxID=2724165 RepID=UPI00164D12EE|nr:fimbrial protein [Providencia sp. JUb39]MBC5791249.1 fimbrial protein [Providencia sp. JUb39]